MRALILLALAAAACGSTSPRQAEPPRPDRSGAAVPPAAGAAAPDPGAPAATPIADQYRDVASRILAAAQADTGAWQKLGHLTDRIGHRLSGSRSLDQAIEWAQAAMKADGHEGVRAEKVMVPHWVRGPESAALIAPVERPIAVLGLGGTVATPRRGLVAEVVVVRDFDEMEKRAEEVKGKIVLFNHPMPAYSEEKGPGYGEAVVYRGEGPARAAALKARGVLVRSVTARSLRSPHTGATHYAEGQKPIPAAAVSVEDAELISRLAAAGEPVKLRLLLSGRRLPDAPSANVVAELRGREKPDEVVVISGHIDSWDVGQGAHDDGAGCVIAMQALTVLRKLGLTPRRTIRAVLFTNEENGLAGAHQYVTDHTAELPRHVMALEADSGAFQPRGFEVEGSEAALRQVTDIATLLEPIGGQRARAGHSGSDVGPMGVAGVPRLGLWMDRSTYFDYHHSEADTLDKVNPRDLALDVAAVAVIAYVVADMPERLAPGPAPERTP
jgi:Zn-dependent M28 family amino/carboxypeptidase